MKSEASAITLTLLLVSFWPCLARASVTATQVSHDNVREYIEQTDVETVIGELKASDKPSQDKFFETLILTLRDTDHRYSEKIFARLIYCSSSSTEPIRH